MQSSDCCNVLDKLMALINDNAWLVLVSTLRFTPLMTLAGPSTGLLTSPVDQVADPLISPVDCSSTNIA